MPHLFPFLRECSGPGLLEPSCSTVQQVLQKPKADTRGWHCHCSYPKQDSSLLKTPLYYSSGQPAMLRAGDVVQGSAQLQLGGRSHHGHDQVGTTSGFSLQPTTHLGFLTALGSRNYAHFVFPAIATNTMHKGYYIFVHPLKTPDSLLATLLPALPS